MQSREERGFISVKSCSDFKGSASQTPLCPIVAVSLNWWACVIGLLRMGFIIKSKYKEGIAMRQGWSHMMPQNWLKMSQHRAELSGKRSHFNLKSAILWPEQGNTSWIWLRSQKKAPFVCGSLTVINIHYHPVTPQATVPVPKLLQPH